jgi:hypothetical protein
MLFSGLREAQELKTAEPAADEPTYRNHESCFPSGLERSDKKQSLRRSEGFFVKHSITGCG